MACIAPLRPHHDDHAARQTSCCNEPLFPVVETVIEHIEGVAFEHDCSIFKGEPPIVERSVALGTIERYSDSLNPQKFKAQLFFVSPDNDADQSEEYGVGDRGGSSRGENLRLVVARPYLN
jgi:hypothetical protein